MPEAAGFAVDLAVVIGIGAYDASVGRLETPVCDAQAVAGLLESRFGPALDPVELFEPAR